MLKWIKTQFSWREVFQAGAYSYFENSITGERKAVKIHYGYSPVDSNWLNRTIPKPMIPPTGGSGVMK